MLLFVLARIVFVIASDDPTWCKTNLVHPDWNIDFTDDFYQSYRKTNDLHITSSSTPIKSLVTPVAFDFAVLVGVDANVNMIGIDILK